MTKETKHLLKWWAEWLKRLILTTYHIFNRAAYRKWKNRRYKRIYNNSMYFDALSIGEDEGFD